VSVIASSISSWIAIVTPVTTPNLRKSGKSWEIGGNYLTKSEKYVTITVSPRVHDLLQAIVLLDFGEIVDVSIPINMSDDQIEVGVSETQRKLVDFIRDGHQFFDRIIVHQGEIKQADFRTEINGYSVIQKVRF
jgi:hypothetical protein